MTSPRQTNSWHWLLMAMVVCLIIAGYLCHLVWKKTSAENGPKLQGMRAHASELQLLQEEDALLLEHQIAEIQKRIHAYNVAVREKTGQPIPKGEQEALKLSNEISRALLEQELRVIEQEQKHIEVLANKKPTAMVSSGGISPEMRRAAAAQAAAAREAEQNKKSFPFTTREIRYVVEGEYRHMFMFLVRQSHLKPSYHFKGIKIFPAPGQFGMRMEFTVQIHFI